MALPAFTVTCAYPGSSSASSARNLSQAILGKIVWQEAPSTGVASTNVAAEVSDIQGQAIFRVRAAADSWLSVGASPNSAGSVRVPIPANTDVDVYAEPGDKFMWQAA
ncbi:hypothetical protein [Rhizobium laguerreae]|uniref:hypothetical protein n=1 Tax=Rhizobium laguerreae TaxID=1076926 RepID=UPI001C9270D8|nr:hypothetical protein [Rhizobium laguerreae]MBY3434805.1 hypothetical protein [Rhizobium laguerreae]MBY3448948.1 hypothetical protein [Rhizobium laguerreae]MBY3456722.1 hypothetical protein [Rhizobium laguerreae]